jgi:hypothetical protein
VVFPETRKSFRQAAGLEGGGPSRLVENAPEFPGASFQDISDFLNTWAVAHPEKPLDAFGRKLIARCIEKEVCRDRFDLHLVLVNLRYCFKSASVPMPDFIMEEKPAAENRQAA